MSGSNKAANPQCTNRTRLCNNPAHLLKSRALVYFFPLLVALVCNLLAFADWLHSPFRHYHLVPGLDMMTHMDYGKRFLEGRMSFSVYRLICGTAKLIGGEDNASVLVAGFQLLTGMAATFICTFTVLHLTRSKMASILAGFFSATYSTAIIYELSTMPEAFFMAASCAVLSLPQLLASKKYSASSLALAGVLLSLPLLTRFSGTLLSLLFLALISFRLIRKAKTGGKTTWKKMLCLLSSFLVPLAFASFFKSLDKCLFRFLPFPTHGTS